MRGGKGGGGHLSGEQRPRPSLCPAGQGWVAVRRGLAGSLVSGGPGPADGAGEGPPKDGEGVESTSRGFRYPAPKPGRPVDRPPLTQLPASCATFHVKGQPRILRRLKKTSKRSIKQREERNFGDTEAIMGKIKT